MVEEKRVVLSVRETAQLLGIGRGLAYEAVRQGVIPSIRIGGRILIPRKALERLIEGGDLDIKSRKEVSV